MPHYDLHIWLFEHNPSGLSLMESIDQCGGAFHVRHVDD